MDFMETSLWRSGFGGDYSQDDKAARLIEALLDMRRLSELLVGEIAADLREYTVHDITHIDALWGVASEIVGDRYSLTPTEAFVLGGAFLLHDSGMSSAAYPGGVKQIKSHQMWPTIVRRFSKDPEAPSQEEVSAAVRDFLRSEHANRARELPGVVWKAPDGDERRLMENGDLRQKFGSFIGEVAASHWWGHDKLSSDLNRVIPAPPPFPTAWSIDLLKLASILRVADAAQIDERRAPGFLWAMRAQHLSAYSNRHWLFQKRLTQPERRGDALHYSSTSDFQKNEAEAWWLAYDTLRMVDNELRRTDVLLADLRNDSLRFRARRVANCETPTTMVQSLPVSGWVPIDTSIHVADVPSLIRALGGEALYGANPLIPIRELVQNAADAVRLRYAVKSDEPGLIKVRIGKEHDSDFLEVSDNGIGMTSDVIRHNLLDFGDSGWSKDPLFLEYPSATGSVLNEITGKFGIGFFAAFMIADKIDLWTRRFDARFSDTLHLKFEGGVGIRPILSPAPKSDWMMSGGTVIRLWLNETDLLFGPRGLDISETPDKDFKHACSRLFPALEIPLEVEWNGTKHKIDGSNWRSEPAESLVKRALGKSQLSPRQAEFCRNVRPINDADGKLVGRLGIVATKELWFFDDDSGVVVTKGVRGTGIQHTLGVIEGYPVRAARDLAVPFIRGKDWDPWIAEQVSLLRAMNLSPETEVSVALIILAMGGDPGDLPLFETRDGWLSKEELLTFVESRPEIKVISDTTLSLLRRERKQVVLEDDIVTATFGFTSILLHRGDFSEHYELAGRPRGSSDVLLDILSEAWRVEKKLLRELMFGSDGFGAAKYVLPMTIAKENGQEIVKGVHWIPRAISWDDLDVLAKKASVARGGQAPEDLD